MVKASYIILAAVWATAQALECHPEGPLVPRPRLLMQSSTFQDALANLTATLDLAFKGEIRAGFDIQNTSVSVGLVSFDQPEASVPIWEYHHLSSANVKGTKTLDKNSQYLVGSVSKAISDAILLRYNLNMDDPITKYLPSLANNASLIQWENITIGALAGHLAGIPPNYGFSEYYYLKDYFEALGFPHLENTSYPECGVIAYNGPCSKEQLLKGMLTSHPVAPPQTRPVYSNIAFTLLMYALEVVTGKNYTQLVHDDIAVPLGMHSTRSSPGDDALAVIPPLPNNWGADYGDNAPGGGLVSTLADLSAFLHAILSRSSALASATQIRAWLKPGTFAGSPSSMVGSPWEIYRPPSSLLFPNTTSPGSHTVTILSKDGAAYGYHARISLLDEYGLGIVILTAGDQGALGTILNAIMSVIIPTVDTVAREEAKREYVSSFKGEMGGVSVNATTEMDGVSVKITQLTRGGRDILEGLAELWSVTAGQFLPPELSNLTGVWRMYPTEVVRERVVEDGRRVMEEDWRMEWGFELDEGGNADSDMPGGKIGTEECLTWALADWMYYGQESVDRFVFVKDAETGRILGLEAPFLRSGVMRKTK